MTHTYVQSTGVWTWTDDKKQGVHPIGVGYSGHGAGVNNPDMQEVEGIGPIPVGFYTIGFALNPPDHLGPLAMPLIPDASNQMFGRSAFFVHGAHANDQRDSSHGCPILDHAARIQISANTDRRLHVIAKVTG